LERGEWCGAKWITTAAPDVVNRASEHGNHDAMVRFHSLHQRRRGSEQSNPNGDNVIIYSR